MTQIFDFEYYPWQRAWKDNIWPDVDNERSVCELSQMCKRSETQLAVDIPEMEIERSILSHQSHPVIFAIRASFNQCLKYIWLNTHAGLLRQRIETHEQSH